MGVQAEPDSTRANDHKVALCSACRHHLGFTLYYNQSVVKFLPRTPAAQTKDHKLYSALSFSGSNKNVRIYARTLCRLLACHLYIYCALPIFHILWSFTYMCPPPHFQSQDDMIPMTVCGCKCSPSWHRQEPAQLLKQSLQSQPPVISILLTAFI